MFAPRAWIVPVTVICLAAGAGAVEARQEPVVRVASVVPGAIYGVVLDETGSPIDGVVISALGGATAFAVTDRAGQYQPAPASAGTVRGPRAPRGVRPGTQHAGQRPFGGAGAVVVHAAPR